MKVIFKAKKQEISIYKMVVAGLSVALVITVVSQNLVTNQINKNNLHSVSTAKISSAIPLSTVAPSPTTVVASSTAKGTTQKFDPKHPLALYTFAPAMADAPIEKSTKKTVYLTFDDGPSANTPKILSILKSEDVNGTFFVISNAYKGEMRSITDSGNEIALHSLTHNYKRIYTSDQAYMSDLEAIRQLVLSETGVNTNVVRFPGGSSNTVSKQYNKGIMTRLCKELTQSGYRYFDWNVSCGDGVARPTVAKEVNAVEQLSPNSNSIMLLLHDCDTKNATVKALPTIIEYYKSKGYIFSVINNETPDFHQAIAN